MVFNKNEQGNLTKKQKTTLSNLIRELREVRQWTTTYSTKWSPDSLAAKKYRAGKKTKMRVSRVAFEPVSMKPAEIRRVRTRLRFSQPEFADFLCTRVGTLRSWEQGSRKPQSSALRLLAIAKEKPALLLQRRGTVERRRPNAVGTFWQGSIRRALVDRGKQATRYSCSNSPGQGINSRQPYSKLFGDSAAVNVLARCWPPTVLFKTAVSRTLKGMHCAPTARLSHRKPLRKTASPLRTHLPSRADSK